MSMSEPLVPPHKPLQDSRAAEHDIDTDTDVFLDDEGEGDGVQLGDLPPNDVFRTPAPGAALDAEQLQKDLDEE